VPRLINLEKLYFVRNSKGTYSKSVKL